MLPQMHFQFVTTQYLIQPKNVHFIAGLINLVHCHLLNKILPATLFYILNIKVTHITHNSKQILVKSTNYIILQKKREECFTKRRFPLYIEFKRSNLLREQMYLIEEHMFLYDMLQANIPIHDTFIFIFLRDNHMLSNNNIPQYLQDIINIIVIYSTTTTIPYICNGPKSKWFSKKRKNPTIYDGHTLCQILNKLFNAPLFALRDELYKYLNIDNNIKLMVQSAAGEWLNNLKTIYHESIIKVNSSNDSEKRMTYKKLMTDIRYKYMKFHFAFAVQDPNASFTHWLLKFEGDNNLLTVDWFANSSILVSVLYNTAIEQRIFWYSCKSKKPSFTKRYATCAKCLMPKNTFVTGSDIGNLIHKWMNKYPKYNGLLNNCQHFVRDMFLVFNESKAKKLTKQLQANNVGFLDPVAGANNSVQQKEREKYMKQMLETELIRCKIFREQNSKKLKKLLDETMLTAFYDKLLDAGYYDEDYHTINDNELKNIGMKECDRIRFLIGSQEKIMAMEQVKSWLINIKLPIYFDAFIANGFDSLYMVQCVTEKELKQMNINMIGHQMQIMKHVAILQ
eukprot:191961_1